MTTMEVPPLPDVMCSQCGRDAIFYDACGPSHAIRANELVQAYARLAIEQDRARPVPGEEDVLHAINQFLEYGEQEFGKSHQGYFSGAGWAARTLREHSAAIRQALRQPPSIDQADRERARVAIADLESWPQENQFSSRFYESAALLRKAYIQ